MSEKIKVPTMAEYLAQGKTPEVLFWVGCAGSFEAPKKVVPEILLKEPETNFCSKCRQWQISRCWMDMPLRKL